MKKIIKKNFLIIIVVIVIIGLIFSSYYIFRSPYKFRGGNRAIKIFWLNSYHSDFPLITENIKAFKDVFEKDGIIIEVKEFDLDELRDVSVEHKRLATEEAIKMIDEYKPDLIYATDDGAQMAILKYINTNIPIVFSGVNEDPQTYGYDKTKNVTGVLEREHFIETIEFLKSLYPNKIKKIGVISQDASQWKVVMERIQKQTTNFPEIEFIGWDRVNTFNEYKKKILEYKGKKVNAIMNFSMVGLVDENNKSVSETEVIKWLIKNSGIPETTFWGFVVEDGVLLSVEVSSEEQGRKAGDLARAILIDGKFPSSFEFKATEKGLRYLNLARAKSLGLKQENIPSVILINSKIINYLPSE
ncbi:MAG: ABC transporter substrate binding protein [Candidatus Shapirobacteria bacterium]|jgi:ABC-type uncharacterized transport system substrate-binding protein